MKYLGIIISIGLIIAGLSGKFVLIGTNSSIALVVVGIIFLISDIGNLVGDKDNLEHANKMEQDTEQLFQNCLEAANNGDGTSQTSLGNMYYDGIGTDIDYVQAASWFRKAADQELPEAQSALGYLYFNGHGVEKDYNKSAMWYKMAAEQNNAEAQYNLGIMYEEGLGLEKNIKLAEYWFRLSADQGYDLAIEKISKWGDNT